MLDYKNVNKGMSPSTSVSTNFKIYELIKSDTAVRHGINNSFDTDAHARAAVYLTHAILQPVRSAFGRFCPSSVFRSQRLEKVLKKKTGNWKSKSQHTKGEACDIEVPGLSNLTLCNWIIDGLDFDQIILECYNPKLGENSGWVHVSVLPPDSKKTNRREVLSYIYSAKDKKYIYVNGIVTDV